MWIDLDDAEIGKIIEAVGSGSVVDKLSRRPHRLTGTFTAAAETKAKELGENLVVEEAGIIDRGNFGAYVMAWLWVTDKEANVPISFEDIDVSRETRKMADQLSSFRVLENRSNPDQVHYVGEMNGYEWHFVTMGTVWMLSASDKISARGGWLHIEEWRPGKAANLMNVDSIYSSIVKSLHGLVINGIKSWTAFQPLVWRKHLELYAFGAMTLERASALMDVDGDVLKAKAASVKEQIEESRRNGVAASFAGPVVDLIVRN